ncbi:MAG TPA: SusC/RagA family TonB-linked outer membrane protein [Longimicrobiales bacterium]|nr:SusC/RagA family TonB-linked outer membrane protein [Longimicrobiales bacterium]
MKLMLRRAFAMAALLMVPTWLSAQETRVTGQVTAEETGQPLAGVQIVVKGTTIGTLSDGNGNYQVRVPAGDDVLVFSYLGYRTVERAATGPVVNVSMNREAIGLEGITVTALGIQREKRSLGYSVQDVQGDQLNDVPELNIVDALQGNVAGVKITSSNVPGGTSRIVIRGASSLSGNNQPLFIVDGVPIDNSTIGHGGAGRTGAQGNQGYGGYDYGNSAAALDPNNIESISVLKGPNAAALYGSRAANGAVVITTKSGHVGGGLGITASVATTFETPLRLPDYQNEYGQGVNGQFQFVDGDGGGVFDHVDESWGPRLDGRTIDQYFGAGPWEPQPDNVRDFFETGVTVNTNVALARTDDRSNVRLSVTNSQMDGMYPTNQLERLSASLAGGLELTDRLRAEGSVNYMNNEGINRPGTGYSGSNVMQQFIWFGRQVDVQGLKNYKCETGDTRIGCELGHPFYNWNYSYHDNPWAIANENGNRDMTDRIIGHASVSYDFTDWLSGTVRSGTDWYEEQRKRTFAQGMFGGGNPQGRFDDELIFNRETNTELLLTATRSLSPDFTLTVNGGANRRDQEYNFHYLSARELVVPGIYTLDNAGATPITDDFTSEKRVNSLYGAANLNYRNYLSLDVTGRNDWSSTLPEENNSYFYPSVSGALVFTDAFDLANDILSSGKVRASWTRVGNDAEPYQTAATFTSGTPWGGIPGYSVPNTLPNTELKPEETTAWEVGTDLGFFNERLGFVFTYYDNSTVNQIMPVQISPAAGFTQQVLNAGEVRNSGLELLLNTRPLDMDNGFRWDMTVNWAKNNSQVRDLYGDLETLVLGTYWSLNVEARAPLRDEDGNVLEYYEYGALFGNGYLRNEDGQILVDDAGYPIRDSNRKVLGNYNPDWTAGLLNRLSFGNLDLSVLFDMQRGGDVFSVTNMFGDYAGVLTTSLRGREDGVCDPGVLVEGVRESDGAVNTNRVCPINYFGGLYGLHEAHIYDASYVKLREMKLGYRLPDSLVGRLGFSSANISLIGRNLALWTDTPHIDPETAFDASNVQGIEFGQFPTARSLGFSVTIRP